MDIKQRDQELNKLIMEGKNMEAVQEFYADNAVTQENMGQKNEGKEAIVEAHKKWEEDLEGASKAELLATSYSEDGNISMTEWHFQFTTKSMGAIDMQEVAVRRWNDDGKIEHERYYYNPAGNK